jgi:hypothetical protein
LMNSLPLSELCRHRHNSDYADVVVMPTSARIALLGRGLGLSGSA